MTTTTHSVASVEAASAEPTLDFATEQIRNGFLAGVTLRTMVNPDTPCEILVPIRLATRIGQLLLDHVEQTQRQQEREQSRVAKEPQPSAVAPIDYRPARRTEKKTPTGAIRFEFTLDTRETLHDWLHPLRGAFYLRGVRQELAMAIYLPKGYWSTQEQRARKPADREKRQLAFTEERIQRVNAHLATLKSRVQVA
ncbi:hypothetical protein, partial [Hymenobacter crusticola]